MNLGFIGLGIMGKPMARNLLYAGNSLTVYNRTKRKAAELGRLGARVAGNCQAVAAASEVIITMVPDTSDVETVLFGANGVASGLRPESVVIDMSTISPSATVQFAERLRGLGCEMLDAPVSGGDKGATEATLAIMVGGRREVFDRCLPIFHALGKNVVYMGANGNGQKTKLVNQVICALNIVAMTEGLHLAKWSGLEVEQVLKVVSSGAAGSWMLSNLAPKILQQDFLPGFMIKLQQKDLRLAKELIESLGVELPGAKLAHELFTKAVEKGLGEQGTQGLVNLW